jgi:hypothetical protein
MLRSKMKLLWCWREQIHPESSAEECQCFLEEFCSPVEYQIAKDGRVQNFCRCARAISSLPMSIFQCTEHPNHGMPNN